MKRRIGYFAMSVFLLLPTPFIANAAPNADLGRPESDLLTIHEVSSIRLDRRTGTGQTQIFRRTHGYEERVINKVIEWIHSSTPSQQAPETEVQTVPIVLKLNMDDGETATLEPAYNCQLNGHTKTCTAADGEIVFSRNSGKERIKSQALYDWLIVGSKYEAVGPPKEEILEETLYERYFSVIGHEFPDFIMCPRIDNIERIGGDLRRHLVTASALNYSGHHDGPNHRIIFSLADTPEEGIKIIQVKMEKDISVNESRNQCRWR